MSAAACLQADLYQLSPAGPTMRPRAPFYCHVRRAADLAGGLVLMLMLSPIVIIAAVAVKLTSPGPIFYWQTRVGLGGRHFRIVKLRSMRVDAEDGTGAVWSPGGGKDSRITPVGRFLRASHVDEFPQLLNVLRGEMTLIGPRPERPEFVRALSEDVIGYTLRLGVKPGITGLAQLRLPPDLAEDDVSEKIKYDIFYILHRGPWLDVKIAAGTVILLCSEVLRACLTPFQLPPAEVVEARAGAFTRADGEEAPARAALQPARPRGTLLRVDSNPDRPAHRSRRGEGSRARL